MSDFNEVKQKLREGEEWRGNIRVSIEGEEYDLTVRQLFDPEFEEVMDMVDRDELGQLREELPQDVLDDYHELRDKEEELTEEEEERMAELQDKLEEESPDIFDILSTSTFEGIRLAAKYAVVPDEEDLRQAFTERASEIEAEYGEKVQVPEDVFDPLKEEMQERIDRATNFASVAMGMQSLMVTVEDEGN